MIQVPYLISYYDGKVSRSFYLADYNNNVDLMLNRCIKSLLIPDYDGYKIYVHNLANFDSVFLMKALVKLGQVQPIINKGRLISIKLKGSPGKTKPEVTLQFLDSYQLLLVSLSKLGEAFSCNVNKGIFPHDFINQGNMGTLNYFGPVPAKEFFSDTVNLEQYNSYFELYNSLGLKDKWSFKNEAIAYCVKDCVSLHEVITKFSSMIWDLFKVNITKYPTISSLTFAIFRTHFLKKDTIPMISGQVFKDIKESYTGGAVDMYLPTNLEVDQASPVEEILEKARNNPNYNTIPRGKEACSYEEKELLYCYDVNSLYPSVMAQRELPTGKACYFEGNILNYKPDALGFYYVKVTAPDDLNHPILQVHHNNTTISPLGTWEMMIYSEEMHNAIKYGYKFEILRGYYFESKTVIFKDYITQLYELRRKYDKTHPMNFIVKILMNSLYGRFGMDDNFTSSKIYDNITFAKIMAKISPLELKLINDIAPIGNTHTIVTSSSDKTDTLLDSLRENHNINIAIASSITALARVEMSKFKNNPLLSLYYTDTDSIFINLSPDDLELIFPNIVGKGIGQLKLEHIIKKAVFLGPKAYFLEPINSAGYARPVIKIKGLNKLAVNKALEEELTFNKFYSLLFKTDTGPLNMEVLQTKWFKNISKGSIDVLEHSYSIKHNNNKRELVYNNFNRLVLTKPYVINKTL